MEKRNARKKIKDRTTQKQLESYVAFLKEHPELQIGKNTPLAPRDIQNLWNQLVEDLNKIKGPKRSLSEWKKTLSHWKANIRFRARKAKVESQMTGGGPQSKVKLSRFEEQALETFDISAIEGIEGGLVLGFSKMQGDNIDEQVSANSVESVSPSVFVPSPMESVSLGNVSSSPPPPSNIQETPFSSRTPKEKQTEQLFKLALINMESQKVREERILASTMAVLEEQKVREERIEELFQIAVSNLEAQKVRDERILDSNLALQQSLEKVANSFATLIELMVKKERKQ